MKRITVILFVFMMAQVRAEEKIRITAAIGGVTKEATKAKVRRGDVLNLGDVLIGENERSRVQIHWNQNKVVLIGKFKFKLEKLSESKEPETLSLLYGRLRSSINKDNGPKGFQVKTPTAVVGVRGTDFFVGYNDILSESEVISFDSEISFQDVANNKSVIVKQGQWGGFGARFGALKEPMDLPKPVLTAFDKQLAFVN